jgi:hypothetical protein
MLVVGSSLEVWPVAGLPLEAPEVAIVNRGPTALDDRAALKIDGDAGSTLGALVATLEGTRALNAFNDLRTKVDDLSRKVRGIDELEARVAKLEKQVADLKRASKATPRSTSARKPAA